MRETRLTSPWMGVKVQNLRFTAPGESSGQALSARAGLWPIRPSEYYNSACYFT